jgi:signal transduction histidine kinase
MTAAAACAPRARRVPFPARVARPVLLEGNERFAACIAHELRAPIALQRALVEVALADPDADTVSLREMGERVLASCEQQERLIAALFDLVRSGRELERREPVDLAVTAARALRAHDLGALRRVVLLEPAWTSGDPALLDRLAANLVANAVRHNVPGGRIEVATRAEPGRAVLFVANTGPPIPPGEVQRLFRPYQRLALRPADGGDGLGLGLAIVQAIGEAHDATVTAEARRGGGLGIAIGFPPSEVAVAGIL